MRKHANGLFVLAIMLVACGGDNDVEDAGAVDGGMRDVPSDSALADTPPSDGARPDSARNDAEAARDSAVDATGHDATGHDASAVGPIRDCAGLRTGDEALGQTDLEAPGYLESIYDPLYGTTITRVTGDPGSPIPDLAGERWRDMPLGSDDYVARHQYVSHQPWNADGTLLYLRLGGVMLDGETLRPVDLQRPPDINHVESWSPVEPDIMLFFRDNVLFRWNVRTAEEERVMDAPGFSNLHMRVRTNVSRDGRMIGAKATRDSDGEEVCMFLDTSSREIGAIISFADYDFVTDEEKARNCGTTPSGQYLALSGYRRVDGGSLLGNNNYRLFNWAGELVATQVSNGGNECPGSHGDWGVDTAGNDALFGVCKRGPDFDELAWEAVTWTPHNGVTRRVGPGSSHSSCRNTGRPGWCFGSDYGESGSEVIAVRLDGTRVEHIANTYSDGLEAYWAQPQAVASPRGDKIVFASNWNNTLPVAHTFVVDIREHCAE